jgi:hypothetical protein
VPELCLGERLIAATDELAGLELVELAPHRALGESGLTTNGLDRRKGGCTVTMGVIGETEQHEPAARITRCLLLERPCHGLDTQMQGPEKVPRLRAKPRRIRTAAHAQGL